MLLELSKIRFAHSGQGGGRGRARIVAGGKQAVERGEGESPDQAPPRVLWWRQLRTVSRETAGRGSAGLGGAGSGGVGQGGVGGFPN